MGTVGIGGVGVFESMVWFGLDFGWVFGFGIGVSLLFVFGFGVEFVFVLGFGIGFGLGFGFGFGVGVGILYLMGLFLVMVMLLNILMFDRLVLKFCVEVVMVFKVRVLLLIFIIRKWCCLLRIKVIQLIFGIWKCFFVRVLMFCAMVYWICLILVCCWCSMVSNLLFIWCWSIL